MIRVLIVEDLKTEREFLRHLFETSGGIEVVGMATNGAEGVDLACRLEPDVITMDINMPVMNGYQATRMIMETCPRPIVILSASWDQTDVNLSFLALEAGATTAMAKPFGFGHSQHETSVQKLTTTVKAMAEVRVVTRYARYRTPEAPPLPPAANPAHRFTSSGKKVVVIGISTGGPPVLQSILSKLPADFPAPMLIVQHISPGFLGGMRDWLQNSTSLPLCIPQADCTAMPGTVYLAPDDYQMGITDSLDITLSKDAPEHSLRPSASYLFRQAVALGPRAIGCLLTGMGTDGARELAMMRQNGAITFAQDQKSSVIFGMPGEAIRLNGATFVMPPHQIAEKLTELLSDNHHPAINQIEERDYGYQD